MHDFEICPVGTMELLLKLEEENKEIQERNIKLYDQLGGAHVEIMNLQEDIQEFIDALLSL